MQQTNIFGFRITLSDGTEHRFVLPRTTGFSLNEFVGVPAGSQDFLAIIEQMKIDSGSKYIGVSKLDPSDVASPPAALNDFLPLVYLGAINSDLILSWSYELPFLVDVVI